MEGFRKEALIKTLKEEYGISTVEELLNALCRMKKLDITQFVASVETKGVQRCITQPQAKGQ